MRAAEWFARNDSRPLEDGHKVCLDVLEALTEPSGIYNLPTVTLPPAAIALWPYGALSILVHGELATFDGDRLTRLVLAAHAKRVRVAIRPWRHHLDRTRAEAIAAWMNSEHDGGYRWDDDAVGLGVMEITLHPRKPKTDGASRWEYHPGPGRLVDAGLRLLGEADT